MAPGREGRGRPFWIQFDQRSRGSPSSVPGLQLRSQARFTGVTPKWTAAAWPGSMQAEQVTGSSYPT